jgi:RNA-directed DNA polymerase
MATAWRYVSLRRQALFVRVERPARPVAEGQDPCPDRGTSQQDLGYVLARLNMVMHGWARFFRHAVAKQTFSMLDYFTWRRVARMLMERHHWGWKEFRRRHTTPEGRWLPITGGQTELRRIDAIPVTRYRYRGSKIPSPWPPARTRLTAGTVESPLG